MKPVRRFNASNSKKVFNPVIAKAKAIAYNFKYETSLKWSLLCLLLFLALVLNGCANFNVSSFKDQPSFAAAHRFPPEAAPTLIKGSLDGNREAQFKLSHAYARGIGLQKNQKEALYWLKQSAKQEYPHAMYKMGLLHAKGGLGVRRDTRQSILWFRRAAKYDQVDALMTLGHLRFKGLHVKQDYAKSMDYYCRAGQQDNTTGLFYCGLMNTHPRFKEIVAQDPEEGLEMLEIAASKGDARAAKLLPYVRPVEPKEEPEETFSEEKPMTEEMTDEAAFEEATTEETNSSSDSEEAKDTRSSSNDSSDDDSANDVERFVDEFDTL